MPTKKKTKEPEPEVEEAAEAPETFEHWLAEAEAFLRAQIGNYPDSVRPGLLNAADGLKTAQSSLRNFEALKREPEPEPAPEPEEEPEEE